jgi:hypothetical protein
MDAEPVASSVRKVQLRAQIPLAGLYRLVAESELYLLQRRLTTTGKRTFRSCWSCPSGSAGRGTAREPLSSAPPRQSCVATCRRPPRSSKMRFAGARRWRPVEPLDAAQPARRHRTHAWHTRAPLRCAIEHPHLRSARLAPRSESSTTGATLRGLTDRRRARKPSSARHSLVFATWGTAAASPSPHRDWLCPRRRTPADRGCPLVWGRRSARSTWQYGLAIKSCGLAELDQDRAPRSVLSSGRANAKLAGGLAKRRFWRKSRMQRLRRSGPEPSPRYST